MKRKTKRHYEGPYCFGGHKLPTSKGAGMTRKGVAKYRRENPGSKLKTAVTEKKPSKARAKKSLLQPLAGQMKMHGISCSKDPKKRICAARRRWRCYGQRTHVTKVKSRYSKWPSAYASGALVKCRKVGAANWGSGGKRKRKLRFAGNEKGRPTKMVWPE